MEHRQKSPTLSSGVVQYMMLMYSDSFFRIVARELTRRNLSPCLKKKQNYWQLDSGTNCKCNVWRRLSYFVVSYQSWVWIWWIRIHQRKTNPWLNRQKSFKNFKAWWKKWTWGFYQFPLHLVIYCVESDSLTPQFKLCSHLPSQTLCQTLVTVTVQVLKWSQWWQTVSEWFLDPFFPVKATVNHW